MRILARRDPIDLLWREFVPELVLGGLEDAPAVRRLCDGADVVIHAAGLVKARSRAQFDAVNVEGARRLAEAAVDAPHVVLVSSLVAREPGLSHYSASKSAGEAAMATLLGERLTIIRPCAIYGPGDRELLPVFQAADALPVLPLLPEGRVTMIHVEDAARQVAALAAARPTSEQPVALCDSRPDGYTWRELMGEAARACGKTPVFATIPRGLARAVGITNDFAALLGGTPMLTSHKARELLHPNWALTAEECANAAPEPIYDLHQGFAQTVAWYRSAAWMKQ